ncbi:unnamed protein product [Staurois parvus]|uniref:Uncharacterized protein n=1 Tax=Staurois parvus TaxID=386267 RepID=A0ABN9DCQ6_9NEOB|nr:unnamed protein product [Staurois parvus]
MTEWGQRILKSIVRRGCQLCAESIAKDLQFRVAFILAQQQSVESFMEWVSINGQLHPSLTSPSAMQIVGCCGIKHATNGL